MFVLFWSVLSEYLAYDFKANLLTLFSGPSNSFDQGRNLDGGCDRLNKTVDDSLPLPVHPLEFRANVNYSDRFTPNHGLDHSCKERLVDFGLGHVADSAGPRMSTEGSIILSEGVDSGPENPMTESFECAKELTLRFDVKVNSESSVLGNDDAVFLLAFRENSFIWMSVVNSSSGSPEFG